MKFALTILHRLRLSASSSRAMAAALSATALLPASAQAEVAVKLLGMDVSELSDIRVDTVFAASKSTEKVTDAPSSVTIVTREDIRRFGYRTLGEIVRSVRSFDVTYDREYSYTTARGYNRLSDYGTRTLLLVDGHRMNDPMFGAASVGTEALLDTDLIERVEFIRGPGSALYGSNAFFAVINIIPRKGASVNGIEASGSYGTFGSYSGRLTAGKKYANGLELLLSATTYESEGNKRLYFKDFDTKANNHGIAENRDGDRFWSMFGSASYGDFTLQGGYVTREKEVATASFDALFNKPTEDSDSRGYAELQYAHTYADGWKTAARAYFDDYDYHSIGRYDPSAPDLLSNDAARQHWWGAEGSISKDFKVLQGFRLTLGTEYRQTLKMERRAYDEVSPHAITRRSGKEQVVSAFIDTHTQLTQTFGFATGLRWDNYSTFGDTVNPRIGLIYKPTDRTTLKALYGQAFRAPSFNEAKYSVQPETIRTTELVAEHYFNAHWQATASIFQNKITDLIGYKDSDVSTAFGNVGKAEVRGVEVAFEGKFDQGWLVRGSYTRQDAEDRCKNRRLENSPSDIAKLQLGIPLHGENLSANLELLYVGDRITLQRQHSGDTILLNATLFSRELTPGLEWSLSLYNILDKRYRVPGGVAHTQDTIEQDGRTIRIKGTYRF